MNVRMTTLERAFGMARSGVFDSVDRIKQALRKEGYADEQIYGRVLRRQLRALIRGARKPEGETSNVADNEEMNDDDD
jgi:hypothetical protein